MKGGGPGDDGRGKGGDDKGMGRGGHYDEQEDGQHEAPCCSCRSWRSCSPPYCHDFDGVEEEKEEEEGESEPVVVRGDCSMWRGSLCACLRNRVDKDVSERQDTATERESFCMCGMV